MNRIYESDILEVNLVEIGTIFMSFKRFGEGNKAELDVFDLFSTATRGIFRS